MTTSTAAGPVLRTLAEVLRSPAPSPAPAPPPVAEPGCWAPGDDGPAPEIAPLIRRLLEFLAGRRPHTQLLPWIGAGMLTELETHRARLSPLGPTLRRLRVQQPAPDTLEVVAVLTVRTGVRSAAARFCREPGGRWQLAGLDVALTAGDRLAARRAG